MQIYYIILTILILVAILGDNFSLKSKKKILSFCGLFLILFAGLRGVGVDNDYKNYSILYKEVPKIASLLKNFFHHLSTSKLEPSFLILSSILKSTFQNGFKVLIFIYALIGVTLKLKAIKQMSDFVLLSLLLYFSSSFLLQEMTQIRAGIATGFALLSIPYIEQKNIKKFLFYILCGVFFHYSVIVFIPFYFLSTKKLDKTLYLSMLLFALLFGLLKWSPIDFISKFNFGVFTEKIISYTQQQKIKNPFEINIFNFSALIQLLSSVFFVIFHNKIESKYVIILTKINCFGIILFYLFASSSSVVAFRLFELMTTVQIILIPLLCQVIKPKLIPELLIILISIAYFLNQTMINAIFKPYITIFNF